MFHEICSKKIKTIGHPRDQNTTLINNVFEQFISTFNTVPIITKCNKSNILEFHFKTHEKNIIIFCCDPSNDISVISFKEVKELCIQNKVEWKNQSYTGFITSLKNNFFDELRGRIKFSKEQRNESNEEFNFKCNVCKRCTKKNHLKLTIFYLYQARVEEQTKKVIFKYYVKHAI